MGRKWWMEEKMGDVEAGVKTHQGLEGPQEK